MDHDVDMGGSAGIVTREEGREGYDAVCIGLLDSAEECIVDVRGIS